MSIKKHEFIRHENPYTVHTKVASEQSDRARIKVICLIYVQSFNDNAKFNFSDVTETEVLYELQSLSVKKATGPDEIPASFLRMAAPYIAKSVCHT